MLIRFIKFTLSLSLTVFVIAACNTNRPNPSTPNPLEPIPLPNIVQPTFAQEGAVDRAVERFQEIAQNPGSDNATLPQSVDETPGAPLSEDDGGDIVGWDLVNRAALERAALPSDSPLPPMTPPNVPSFSSDSSLEPQGSTNLSPITPFSNPRMQRVKLKSYFPTANGFFSGCSGTLIDSRWVITAAHCIFTHDDNDEDGNPDKVYASSVEVFPGYDNGPSEVGKGKAFSTKLLTYRAWREDKDFDHDIGWLELNRPIGGIVGYHAISYSTDCNFFKSPPNGRFESNGYPGKTLSDGETMYRWRFEFDSCDTRSDGSWHGYEVRLNKLSYGGQSGSGAVSRYGDGTDPTFGGIVWAVLSNGDDDAPSTEYARITRGKYRNIYEDIANSSPATPDLVPLMADLSPPLIFTPASTTLEPQRFGDTFIFNRGQRAFASFDLHNTSYKTFRGDVTFTVYLSTNSSISSGDTALGSFTFRDLELFGKQTLRPPDVQQSASVTIPSNITSGTYHLGVIITNSDANTLNNDSSGEDAVKITVQ